MSRGDLLELEGTIVDALGGGQYAIKVDQGGSIVRAQLSGRMRRFHIRVLPGDRVRVAVSPYDPTHGLIVYRGKLASGSVDALRGNWEDGGGARTYEGAVKRFRLASPLAASILWLAACGGGDEAPNGTSADAFINEYCNLTARCCDPGKGDDPVGCAKSFSDFQAIAPRKYDAAKAGACLARLREVEGCDFEAASADCDEVLGGSDRVGSAPVGAACQTAGDCARSSEGTTTCSYPTSGTNRAARCQVTIDGAEGAACDGTRSGKITAYVESGADDKDRVVVCDGAKDLVCDKGSRVCEQLGAPGAPCSTWSDCKSQLCQSSKCLARAEIGESCAATSCVETAYCDESRRCVEKLATGAACTGFSQCKTGGCNSQQVCEPFQKSPPLGCYYAGD